MKSVFIQIKDFNRMYNLPSPELPTCHEVGNVGERVKNFKKILLEEMEEFDPLISKIETMVPYTSNLDILTEMADLYGDIIVYCLSEMEKFGLPQEIILRTIMDSNFSKLGPDNEPLYDERGKVMKGPNYWKPEPRIRQHLQRCMKESEV